MERDNVIDYRLNEGNNNRRIRRNNKIRRYPNHNQENYSEETSDTAHRELGGDGSTSTCGTG